MHGNNESGYTNQVKWIANHKNHDSCLLAFKKGISSCQVQQINHLLEISRYVLFGYELSLITRKALFLISLFTELKEITMVYK